MRGSSPRMTNENADRRQPTIYAFFGLSFTWMFFSWV
jgi:hypothetical protein